MNRTEFYRECALLLDTDHNGKPFPYYKRTRWNNRAPGQGRFEGHGIIRHFGSVIHVALNGPYPLRGIFYSEAEALIAIEKAVLLNRPFQR